MRYQLDHEELARKLILRGIEAYREKFIREVDVLSGYDRQRILEEIDKQTDDIKHSRSYKKEAERLQRKLEYLQSLEDCDEEFEL